MIKADCTLLDRERLGRWKSAWGIRSSRPSRVASEGGDLARGNRRVSKELALGAVLEGISAAFARRRINEMGGHEILVRQI
jgi:hypothetical protein